MKSDTKKEIKKLETRMVRLSKQVSSIDKKMYSLGRDRRKKLNEYDKLEHRVGQLNYRLKFQND